MVLREILLEVDLRERSRMRHNVTTRVRGVTVFVDLISQDPAASPRIDPI